MSANPHVRPVSKEECAEFQARLPQLFASGADLAAEEHTRSCDRCAELLRDLEYIAQQAKLLMPIHDPSPAVWNNIKSALDTDGDGKK